MDNYGGFMLLYGETNAACKNLKKNKHKRETDLWLPVWEWDKERGWKGGNYKRQGSCKG